MKTNNVLAVVLLGLGVFHASAQIKLPAIFSDHMVLQRNASVPIWGWAAPKESVTVIVGVNKESAVADQKGQWKVNLQNLAASDTPLEVDVTGQNSQVAIHDVLIGDVWLCAGESDMASPLGQSSTAKDELPKANHPAIRFFVPKFETSLTPRSDLEGHWQICTPETAKVFSELGYYFSKEIADTEKTPIGVIGLYGSGASAQAWISLDSLEAAYDLNASYVRPFAQGSGQLDLVALGQAHDQWLASGGNIYLAALRKWKSDNAIAQKNKLASPPRPPPAAQPEPPRPYDPRLPATLNNALIAPLAPFAVKGVVWYQGESNQGQTTYRSLLSTLVDDWRKRWQRQDLPFFLVQTPPRPAKISQANENSPLAVVREAQMLMLTNETNTGLIPTIDMPCDKEGHSLDNADIAHRLTAVCRNVAYGENILSEGPLFDSYRIDGNKIYVTFKNVGHGLRVVPSPNVDPAQGQINAVEIKGFAIAGIDRQFFWAKASLEGPDTVSVSADQVSDPSFVRYGWNDAPEINLYNDSDLPACPFRSDKPYVPLTDAFLVAQSDNFFSIDKILYYDKLPYENCSFFKDVPGTNNDGSPTTTKVFTPYIEADVRVQDATNPALLIARAYFYDRDKKLIANVQEPDAPLIGTGIHFAPIWPGILSKDTPQPIFFVIPDAVLESNSWSAVVVFGDSKGVAAQLYSRGDDFATLSDFDYPGKEPPKQQANNTLPVAENRQAAVDPIVTDVEQTGNPAQPQITLFMRPPLGVSDLSKAKGVLCLSLLAGSLESVKNQLQGFEPNKDLSGTLKFAEDHQLIIICWGARGLWDAKKNWDDLSADSAWDSDRAFDQVADAWEHGVQHFIKDYKIPPNGYLLWGMSGSAQYACRLALRKPDYFLAIHAHIPSSFDKPNPDARKILWCLTTGELESGHARSLRFYAQCKALGYPMIYKAVVGLGHADSPIAEDLGTKFFEYALSVRDQRLAYDSTMNDPLAQFQAAQNSPTGSAPWIESFCKPAYVGDIVNQEMFPSDETAMVPEAFRTPLPTKEIADAWNK